MLKCKLLTVHHSYFSSFSNLMDSFNYCKAYDALTSTISKINGFTDVDFSMSWFDFATKYSDKMSENGCPDGLNLIGETVACKMLYGDKQVTLLDIIQMLAPFNVKANVKKVIGTMAIYGNWEGNISNTIHQLINPDEYGPRQLHIYYDVYNTLCRTLMMVVYSFKSPIKRDGLHYASLFKGNLRCYHIQGSFVKYLLSITSALKYNGFPKYKFNAVENVFFRNDVNPADIEDEIVFSH